MSVFDEHAIRVRADAAAGQANSITVKRAHDLERLALDFLFLAADKRNHVAEHIDGREPGISGARQCLQRCHNHSLGSERLVNRRKGHHQRNRRAIGIGHDRARPAAALTLNLDELEMIGINFGDQQRHVFVHPMVPGIADDEVARSSEALFDLTSDRCIEPGKHDATIERGLARFDLSVFQPLGNRLVLPPGCSFFVALSCRPIGSCKLFWLEPGMILEQRD